MALRIFARTDLMRMNFIVSPLQMYRALLTLRRNAMIIPQNHASYNTTIFVLRESLVAPSSDLTLYYF